MSSGVRGNWFLMGELCRFLFPRLLEADGGVLVAEADVSLCLLLVEYAVLTLVYGLLGIVAMPSSSEDSISYTDADETV